MPVKNGIIFVGVVYKRCGTAAMWFRSDHDFFGGVQQPVFFLLIIPNTYEKIPPILLV